MWSIDPKAMYYSLLRNILFYFNPKKSQRIALTLLRLSKFLKLNKYFFKIKQSPCIVMGLRFPNPVGLAAGLDKNGEYKFKSKKNKNHQELDKYLPEVIRKSREKKLAQV